MTITKIKNKIKSNMYVFCLSDVCKPLNVTEDTVHHRKNLGHPHFLFSISNVPEMHVWGEKAECHELHAELLPPFNQNLLCRELHMLIIFCTTHSFMTKDKFICHHSKQELSKNKRDTLYPIKGDLNLNMFMCHLLYLTSIFVWDSRRELNES